MFFLKLVIWYILEVYYIKRKYQKWPLLLEKTNTMSALFPVFIFQWVDKSSLDQYSR